MTPDADVVVIGGGFYGAMIAADLGARGRQVILLEAGDRLLPRASTFNQARVHGGYHYPRSVSTGLSSQRHYRRFVQEFGAAVAAPRIALYAIARQGSWTTPGQFSLFCRRIEAPCRRADDAWRGLFEPSLVADVFEVDEAVLDVAALADAVAERLVDAGVDVRLGVEAAAVRLSADGVEVDLQPGGSLQARSAVNATYWRLNEFGAGSAPAALQHEWAEMSLCRPPAGLRDVAVTVVDGPFFSLLPFHAAGPGVSTLSHVRYTPHACWADGDPQAAMIAATPPQQPRFAAMLRDAARYLPALREAVHERSTFEIKTVPANRDDNDARPIIFAATPEGRPRVASVLGSKLDLVYDVLPRVESFVDALEVPVGS